MDANQIFQKCPSMILVFRLNREKDHFSLYAYTDKAKEFFSFEQDKGEKEDILDFWKKYFDGDDTVRLFEYADYLIHHPGESISFTCRAKKDGKLVWLAGFVNTEYIGGELYAYASYYALADLELLDQEFWSQSVPAHLVLEDVLRTTAYPIYWVDRNLRFLGMNKAMLDYFGFDNVQQLLGKNILELHLQPENLSNEIRKNQFKALEHLKPTRGEMTIQAKGEQRRISYIENPIVQEGNIVGLVGSFTDITKEKEAQARLKEMADLDYLTGLPNRRAFYAALGLEQKDGKAFSILMMDLDRFKSVNDRYGHEAGDYVLIESGKAIREVIGAKGCAARWGGDEFIAYLLSSDEKDILLVEKEIEEAISKIDEYQGHRISVGISIGYAVSGEERGMERLIGLADRRMYEAKKKRKEERK